MQTDIELPFADGHYRFALGLARIHEVETKCDSGIGAIYARVLAGRVPGDPTEGHPAFGAYRLNDLVEVIRQGLIGGGEGRVDGADVKVSASRANELIERYGPCAPGVPLSEMWALAASILFAAIEGYAPAVDEVKKNPANPETTTAG